jgi:capsular exopolysaccharide synthesis family protein
LSRNFELLSEAGRMHEMMQPQVEQPQVAPPPVEDTFSSTPVPESAPTLEMNGAIRDEIAKLVQNLFTSSRRVVFSGTESGSGCSWMTARAALMLAQQGRGSVCLVDCNLRSPGLHQQFSLENHHGLSDALMGSGSLREYATRLSQNLWLLSCGSTAEDGHGLIGSESMRSRLTELKRAFDYVLIDAAPLNSCNDAVVLGTLSDGVVLVLKANASRRETARRAVQDIQNANVKVLGAVLNERTFPIPEKLYKRL